MITKLNKDRDHPMSLGDRDSYYKDFDTNNLLKGEKDKTGDTHSDDLSALFKNSTENNNNGPVVSRKESSQTMMVVITLRQKFRVVRIRPRPCLALR